MTILATLRILIKGIETPNKPPPNADRTANEYDLSPHDRAGLREERWYPDLVEFLGKPGSAKDRDLSRS